VNISQSVVLCNCPHLILNAALQLPVCYDLDILLLVGISDRLISRVFLRGNMCEVLS
jgi:hypothetical protein